MNLNLVICAQQYPFESAELFGQRQAFLYDQSLVLPLGHLNKNYLFEFLPIQSQEHNVNSANQSPRLLNHSDRKQNIIAQNNSAGGPEEQKTAGITGNHVDKHVVARSPSFSSPHEFRAKLEHLTQKISLGHLEEANAETSLDRRKEIKLKSKILQQGIFCI